MITFIHRLIRVTRQGLNVAKTFSYLKENPFLCTYLKNIQRSGLCDL